MHKKASCDCGRLTRRGQYSSLCLSRRWGTPLCAQAQQVRLLNLRRNFVSDQNQIYAPWTAQPIPVHPCLSPSSTLRCTVPRCERILMLTRGLLAREQVSSRSHRTRRRKCNRVAFASALRIPVDLQPQRLKRSHQHRWRPKVRTACKAESTLISWKVTFPEFHSERVAPRHPFQRAFQLRESVFAQPKTLEE